MNCKIVADDYGMCSEINRAISELVKKNIISKVGVMANESISCSGDDLKDNVEAGMHIDFVTNPEIVGSNYRKKKTSLLKLLYLLYTGRLNIDNMLDIINRQYKILHSRGFKISYLDTHQHVHVVPKVLKSVITFAKANNIESIRCITLERKHLLFYLHSFMRYGFSNQVPKMIFLYAMGILMKLKLDKAGINYSKNLVLMPLAWRGDYAGLLKEFLDEFKDKDAEIVIHPGIGTQTIYDDGYVERYIEYHSILQQESECRREKI